MDHVELTSHCHRLAGSLLADVELRGGKCLAQPVDLVYVEIDYHVEDFDAGTPPLGIALGFGHKVIKKCAATSFAKLAFRRWDQTVWILDRRGLTKPTELQFN